MARTKAMALEQQREKRRRETEEDYYGDYEDEDDEEEDGYPDFTSVPAAVAEPRHRNTPASRDGWDTIGEWAVTTNDRQYNSSRGPYDWSFFHDSDGHSYVHFAIGFLKGVMILEKRLADILPPRRNKTRFVWRGRETGEGEMQIDDSSQTGDITFKQQEGGFMVLEGRMRGSYCGSEGLRFIGFKVKDRPSRSSSDWSLYNSRQYERERVARWR